MVVAIRLEQVSKSYRKKVQALQSVSFEIPCGIVLGVVGPNGSGKSTLLKLITGLIRPNTGSITVLGGRPGDLDVLDRLGYCPEIPQLNEHLTVAEYLDFCGRFHAMEKPLRQKQTAELAHTLGFSDLTSRVIRTLSKGQRQRVNLAQGLMGSPELLLLDEPFNGLDPTVQKVLRSVVRDLRSQGSTIVINSHQLAEVEELSDQVIMLTNGTIANTLSLTEERQAWSQVVYSLPQGVNLAQAAGAETLSGGRRRIQIRQDELGPWLVDLIRTGGMVHEVREGARNLEDRYEETVLGGNGH